jgi:hypothetical protein
MRRLVLATLIIISPITILMMLGWLTNRFAASDIPPMPQPAAGQFLEITRGRIFESSCRWDEAQSAFESALKAQDASVAALASNDLDRLIQRRNSPAWQVNCAVMKTVSPIRDALLFAVLILLAGCFVLWAVRKLPRRDGFLIEDFDAAPGTDAAVPAGFRRDLANCLRVIQLVHRNEDSHLRLINERIVAPEFSTGNAPQDEISKALGGLTEIPLLPASNNWIAKMLDSARTLMDRRRYSIAGSLTKTADNWECVASVRNVSNDSLEMQWVTTSLELPSLGLGRTEPLRDVAYVLAHRILFDLVRRRTTGLQTKSWKSFFYLTESLRAVQRCSVDASELDATDYAIDCMRRVVYELDPSHRLARFNLGLLYLAAGKAADAANEFDILVQRIEAQPELLINTAFEKLKARAQGTGRSAFWNAVKEKIAPDLREIQRLEIGSPIYTLRQELEELPEQLIRLELTDEGKAPFEKLSAQIDRDKTRQLVELFDELKDRTARLISSDIEERSKAIAEVESLLDEELFREVHRTLSIRISVDWLKATSEFDDETLRKRISELVNLAGQVRLLLVKAPLETIARLLNARKWSEASQAVNAGITLTQPADPYKSRQLAHTLVMGLNERLSKQQVTELHREIPEFARLRDWLVESRGRFHLECLYNRALSLYQAFTQDSLVQALDRAHWLLQKFDELPGRIEARDIRSLTLCLYLQIAIRIALAYDEGPPDEKIELIHDMDGLYWTVGRWPKDLLQDIDKENYDTVVKLTDEPSSAVKACALSTLGLRAHYNRSPEALTFLEASVDQRPWADTYVFLAEVKMAEQPDEARRLLQIALKLCPNHALAKRLSTVAPPSA